LRVDRSDGRGRLIEYTDRLDGLEPRHLEGFFVGWPSPPSAERHLELLRGSAAVALARESEDGRIVGFASAVGDGVLTAYIPLLEVLPAYQGRGIGSELVRRLLAGLGAIYMIDVCCDAELEPFYRRLGFQTLDRGMGIRNYEAAAG
jgi:ribosomal protein S18 acetylase RimI-like enzyme